MVRRPLILTGLGGAFPFFASALFFLSGFLTLFSALPLMLLFWRYPRQIRLVGLLTNTALVIGLSKLSGSFEWGRAYGAGVVFLCVLAPVVLLVPDLIFRGRWNLTKAGALAWFGSLGLLAVAVWAWSHNVGMGWGEPLRAGVHSLMTQLTEMNQSTGSPMPWGDVPVDQVEQQILLDMPSGIALGVLLMVWISMVSVIRVVPAEMKLQMGMDPLVLSRWKAPEWWVWPTLVFGALMLKDFGRFSEIAYSGLRMTLAVYVLEGLSVLAFVLDRFKIRGLGRSLIQGVAVFGLLPIVVAMGFFDLWFDFRSRIKQNS